MKKVLVLVLILLITLAISGCCSMGNEAVWKNWDHAKFSYTGYTSPTYEDVIQSSEENWWGCEVLICVQ